MLCDMCGNPGKLFKTIVEGTELSVCKECSRFGKVVGFIELTRPIAKAKSEEPKTEVMELLVEDYAEKIRKKRESLGLNQKEFAKKLNEKESLVQKIESGHFEPSIGLAKKISRILQIKLVEEYEERHEKQPRPKVEGFTLGDFIKIKK